LVFVLPIVVVDALPEVVVDVMAVPEVVVAVVSVVIVPEVSVIVPDGMAVELLDVAPAPVVSVVVIVPVVDEVSVVELVLIAVSVAAVSVLTVSSFLQPTAKTATANSATRVTYSDFFIIRKSPSNSQASRPGSMFDVFRYGGLLGCPITPLFISSERWRGMRTNKKSVEQLHKGGRMATMLQVLCADFRRRPQHALPRTPAVYSGTAL
jgi:hypothetical protein